MWLLIEFVLFLGLEHTYQYADFTFKNYLLSFEGSWFIVLNFHYWLFWMSLNHHFLKLKLMKTLILIFLLSTLATYHQYQFLVPTWNLLHYQTFSMMVLVRFYWLLCWLLCFYWNPYKNCFLLFLYLNKDFCFYLSLFYLSSLLVNLAVYY